MEKHPPRLFIYSRDVENMTGLSRKTSQGIMNHEKGQGIL
jgi:hypothetical protein